MPRIFFPSSKPRFVNPSEVIQKFRQIAQTVKKNHSKVEEIFLFGSYAQGNAALRSDADILVVLSRDSRPMMKRLDEFILAFLDGPSPVDVLVYTRQEINAEIKRGNRFLKQAVQGIKLI